VREGVLARRRVAQEGREVLGVDRAAEPPRLGDALERLE